MKVTRFLCRNSYTVVHPTTPSTASTSLSQAAASASPLPRWIATGLYTTETTSNEGGTISVPQLLHCGSSHRTQHSLNFLVRNLSRSLTSAHPRSPFVHCSKSVH